MGAAGAWHPGQALRQQCAEPQYWRGAGCLQPGRVHRAAAGDVVGVVELHRQVGTVGQSGDVSPSAALVAFFIFG